MFTLSQNLRMSVGKSLLLIRRTSELFWTSSEIIGCLLKNILRSSTKNWGTCRASHEDENLDKLTPLWYQNVKVKRSVFALRMMSDELSSWKVALYARYRQALCACREKTSKNSSWLIKKNFLKIAKTHSLQEKPFTVVIKIVNTLQKHSRKNFTNTVPPDTASKRCWRIVQNCNFSLLEEIVTSDVRFYVTGPGD